MKKTLSLDLRPSSFDEMIGQSSLIKSLRNQYASKREPHALLFYGDTGSGKTTLARILALSLQCKHGELGSPCKACLKNTSEFHITEVNASDVNKVEAIQQIADYASYAPFAPSRRRVIILDEAQRLTNASQNMLLKPFEDAPSTTVWMICTTEPGKLLKALRGRCMQFGMEALSTKHTKQLLERAAKHIHYKKGIEDLVEELVKQKVSSPRNILYCFEKMVSGSSAEEAVIGGEATVNVLRICQAVVKGDIETAMETLKYATTEDCRIIRERLALYLTTIITSNMRPNPYCTRLIMRLAESSRVDEALQLPYLTAILHEGIRGMVGGKVVGKERMVDSESDD